MKLCITNIQRALVSSPLEKTSVIVEISSFQANPKLVSLKVGGNKKEVKAAIRGIGLWPTSQQDGGLLILQADQIHIKGGEEFE